MITTIIIVLSLYFIAMIAISWAGRKHASDFTSYLNVGRSAGLILCIGGHVGAHIGNGLVVGGAGEGAAVGLSGAAYGLGCALSYVILGLLANNMIYKGNYLSPADFLTKRYGNELPAQVFNVATVFSFIGSIGAQLIAGKALFKALGLNGTVGLIIIALVVFLYSQISGLWGAMATSVVQIAIVAVGVLSAVAYIFADGGMELISGAVAAGSVPDTFLSPIRGNSLETWILLVAPTTLSALTDQTGWQRINSAKSAKASKASFLLSALIIVPLSFAPVLIGMYANVKFGSTGNSAFFNVVLNTLPPIFAALVVAAVIAAVMSTIDALLIAFSTILLRGVYKGHINKKATDQQLSKMTLGLNIVVIAFSIGIALVSTSVVNTLANTYLFLSAACLIPFLGGWLWKKATTAGAVLSSLVGVVIVLLQMLGIYTMPYYAITLFVPSLIVFVVVSLLTQKNVPDAKAA